jgi:hypothetical protein
VAAAFSDPRPGALESKSKWHGRQVVRITLSRVVLFWFLVLGIAIGIQVSILSEDVKVIVARIAAVSSYYHWGG